MGRNRKAKAKSKSATQTGQGQEQEAGKGEGNKYEEHAQRQEHEQEGQGHGKKVTDRDTCPPPNIPLGPASPTRVGPPSRTPAQRQREKLANQYVDGKNSISRGLDIDRALDDLRRQLVDEYNKQQQTLPLQQVYAAASTQLQQVYAALTQAHNLRANLMATRPPLDIPAIERINDVINKFELLKGILQWTDEEGWTGCMGGRVGRVMRVGRVGRRGKL